MNTTGIHIRPNRRRKSRSPSGDHLVSSSSAELELAERAAADASSPDSTARRSKRLSHNSPKQQGRATRGQQPPSPWRRQQQPYRRYKKNSFFSFMRNKQRRERGYMALTGLTLSLVLIIILGRYLSNNGGGMGDSSSSSTRHHDYQESSKEWRKSSKEKKDFHPRVADGEKEDFPRVAFFVTSSSSNPRMTVALHMHRWFTIKKPSRKLKPLLFEQKKILPASSTGTSGANAEKTPRRTIDPPMTTQQYMEKLNRSKDWKKDWKSKVESWETETCKAQYDWQLQSFPSCNLVHEFDLTSLVSPPPPPLPTTTLKDEDRSQHDDEDREELVRLVANGYWRDVWFVQDGLDRTRVLKTIRWKHDYKHRNYERHRRDALAMERLTPSPYVMDIYGYCGNSGLFEYGDGGDLEGAIFPPDEDDDSPAGSEEDDAAAADAHVNNSNKPPKVHNHKGGKVEKSHRLTKMEKLRIAADISSGLAAVHNFGNEGQASIAHTDITPGQFLPVNGIWKLNDFNRARFILWNYETQQACPYTVPKNPGKNRSPEEYNYENQTEMVDVYSLGNIFYELLQGEYPFEDVSKTEAIAKVKRGERPSIYSDIWNSTNPVDQTLKKVMMMCHEQDPENRPSARELETLLRNKLKELDPSYKFY